MATKMAPPINWQTVVTAAITLIFIGLLVFAIFKSTEHTETPRIRCGNNLLLKKLLDTSKEKIENARLILHNTTQ